MPVTYEHPQVTRSEATSGHDQSKITHPAYAQISASHVIGGKYLYGSDFQHQHYVCVRICFSEMNRHLSNDWPFAGNEIIEVAMSESQWASFVSSMNRGQGIQCTIQHIHHKQVPQIPEPEHKTEQFRMEGRESAQETLNRIDALTKSIQDSKLSQKQKDEWSRDLSFIRDRTKSNLQFVLQQFAEHMERTVTKAKTEISAYAHHLIVRSGLAKLTGTDPDKKILGYEERNGDEDK
jgi:hypothetical protein